VTLRTRAGLAIATALGSGYAPKAPGTVGSAVGLLLWIALPKIFWLQIAVIVIITVAGVWSGTVAEDHFGRRDPGQVVIDEVSGMMITVLMNPLTGPLWTLVAFLLFRAADIAKPYPIDALQRLPGGLGIMADDVLAGVYANLALRAAIWLSAHFHLQLNLSL